MSERERGNTVNASERERKDNNGEEETGGRTTGRRQ